ncbi:MAG: DUF3881 family protein [Lachnospiraceae bacterium]|nr:DUF3881 family protein [Lachnospiraceae bacterium]
MHSYLRAVGFSNINSRKDLKELLNNVVKAPNRKSYLEGPDKRAMVEYTRFFAGKAGITLRGEFDNGNELTLDHYFPVVDSDIVSTTEELTIERNVDKDSYAGVCEDSRVGVSLIFGVQNGLDYIRQNNGMNMPMSDTSVCFCALSVDGIIMLPIQKDDNEKAMIRKAASDRNERIMAARNGDEDALEQLALEDIDTYTSISRQILNEDVFTLVESYMMPYGVECDLYSILAEIEKVDLFVNEITGEEVYIMDLNYNCMPIALCINKKDVLGEPEPGRRFKGVILLQGKVIFE